MLHKGEREISRSQGLGVRGENGVGCFLHDLLYEKLVLGKDSGSGLMAAVVVVAVGEKGGGEGSDCRMEPVNSHSLLSAGQRAIRPDLNRIVRRSGDDAGKEALVALR